VRPDTGCPSDCDPDKLRHLGPLDVTPHGGGLPRPITGRVRVARLLRTGLRHATTLLGGLSLRVGEQLFERTEVPVLGGGEEPPGQALPAFAGGSNRGRRCATWRRARATSWRALSSLVATMVAIWS
jgi:hypothetical protein